MFEPYIQTAAPQIISGVAMMIIGAAIGWAANKYRNFKQEHEDFSDMKHSFDDMIEEHKIVMSAIRNINRSTIIDICSKAMEQNYISETQFKCLCDLEESYHDLHGNSYADEVIEKTKTIYHTQELKGIR